MIFITVGTQPSGFLHCLQEIEMPTGKYGITEEIVAQIGDTDFETDKFTTTRSTGENEFKKYIKNASVVIFHTGSDAPFNSIKAGKEVIAVARLHEFNEMADNHQIELVKKLSDGGHIVDGTYSLVEAWPKLEGFVPRNNDFKCEIVLVSDRWISAWMEQEGRRISNLQRGNR